MYKRINFKSQEKKYHLNYKNKKKALKINGIKFSTVINFKKREDDIYYIIINVYFISIFILWSDFPLNK